VFSLAFSLNGTKLVTGSEDKLVRIWDSQTWKLSRRLRGHKDKVLSVAIHQNKLISAGSGDHTIRIRDMRTGNTVSSLKADKYWNTVTVSSDGKDLAAGSSDGTVMLWEIK
jgi:WD40 repeat protein